MLTRLYRKPDIFDELETLFTTKPAESLRSKVEQSDNAWNIYLEIPGFTEDEVKIEADQGVLSVNATHEKTEKTSHFRSSVKRSWTLPETVDEDNIVAELKNGVLSLSLPKKESSLPKKREIKLLKS